MRIRTIKPEFFTHEGLYELEAETKLPIRIAFAGLWCIADRSGRFKWEPRRIGIAILPYDNCDFSRVLDALTTRGFVVRYRVESRDFGHIPSFERHQVINNREKPSDLPEPSPANVLDATTTRAPRVPHASKEEGKGREGKGKEGEVSLADASEGESKKKPTDGFDDFWNAYPKKVAKPDAQRAWVKHQCCDLLAEILASLSKAKACFDWTKEAGQFIPHPATWLNRRGWEDDYKVNIGRTCPIPENEQPEIWDPMKA